MNYAIHCSISRFHIYSFFLIELVTDDTMISMIDEELNELKSEVKHLERLFQDDEMKDVT